MRFAGVKLPLVQEVPGDMQDSEPGVCFDTGPTRLPVCKEQPEDPLTTFTVSSVRRFSLVCIMSSTGDAADARAFSCMVHWLPYMLLLVL